jgi:hypothetical protein
VSLIVLLGFAASTTFCTRHILEFRDNLLRRDVLAVSCGNSASANRRWHPIHHCLSFESVADCLNFRSSACGAGTWFEWLLAAQEQADAADENEDERDSVHED